MISLSPEEDTFLSLLDEFAREGRKFEDNGVGEVECRIAGGWVRDKVCRGIFAVLDGALLVG